MLEATNDVQYLLPIMLVIMISKWVGDSFTIALYDHYIELSVLKFINFSAIHMWKQHLHQQLKIYWYTI